LIVRPATPADAESIARVHVQAWDETYHGLVPPEAFDVYTLEKRLTQWRSILGNPATTVFVAERDSAVCGFGSGGRARDLPTDGEIYALYVVRAAKRQGVGGALFVHLRNALTASDFASLGLWVLSSNLAARQFYEAMGGRTGGTKIDRRGELAFEDIAYLWESASPRLR